MKDTACKPPAKGSQFLAHTPLAEMHVATMLHTLDFKQPLTWVGLLEVCYHKAPQAGNVCSGLALLHFMHHEGFWLLASPFLASCFEAGHVHLQRDRGGHAPQQLLGMWYAGGQPAPSMAALRQWQARHLSTMLCFAE